MVRRWWLGGLLILCLSSVLLARQGVIKTKDGQTLEGDIDDTHPDGVYITIHNVQTTVHRSDIASITYAKDPRQEFNERMGKLGPADIKGRLDLARFEFEQGHNDLAREAVESAQKIDPNNRDAADLKATIEREMALKPRDAGAPAAPATPAPAANAAAPTTGQTARYLSARDVNAIKQKEMRPDENLRVRFDNDVKRRYLALGVKQPREFNSETPSQQAQDILATNDPKLAEDVIILSDPETMATFHSKVQPAILAGCAAAGCHSSEKGGDFILYPNSTEPNVWYTNFYIIQNYTKKVQGVDRFPGGQGAAQRGMIDRAQPDQSLLLQYGMPPNLAAFAHPEVSGYRPVFRSPQDARYQSVLNWIQSLNPVKPDYGIKFTPPGQKPTTQPSGERGARLPSPRDDGRGQ